MNSIPPFEEFTGDWKSYVSSLYSIFSYDFIRGQPVYLGLKVKVKYFPPSNGKAYRFWHLIQTDNETDGTSTENERIPDLERCKRIRWISWVIENAKSNPDIYCWSEENRGDHDIVLWFECERYLVILSVRKGYYLLKTAYYVDTGRFDHKYKTLVEKRKKHCNS